MQRSGGARREARIVVGTSSWSDPGFVEEWYPRDLAARDRLPWYAERFDGVEVNSTFYAIPGAAQVRRWVDVTPDGFTFDVKLHRLLSRHSAGEDSLPPDLRERATTGPRGRVVLDDALEDALAGRLLEAIDPLVAAGRLRCLLLQLTPGFSPRDHALGELAPLVERLAPHPVAIELRNRGWVREDRVSDTLGWFEAHGAVWVAVDAPAAEHFTIMPPIDAVTRAGMAYLRLHGRDADRYIRGRTVAERFAYRYADDELEEIAGRAHRLAERAGEGGEVRVMANNNRGADAPLAAQRMRELLES
jgi:uncharacterized protein YecE (DUF72 family)